MTTHYFADWRDVPDKLWRWSDFSPEEIACRGDGKIQINEAALDKLQVLRDQLGVASRLPLAGRSCIHFVNFSRWGLLYCLIIAGYEIVGHGSRGYYGFQPWPVVAFFEPSRVRTHRVSHHQSYGEGQPEQTGASSRQC